MTSQQIRKQFLDYFKEKGHLIVPSAPIVLKDDVEIKLKVSSRVPEYSLSLDSRLYHMNIENEVILKKADFCLNLMFPKNINFYETLRQKLLWGNDKRN